MNTILEIQNLKKYFSSQKAVDDISFSIEKGSIFGLLGPNGAGKTTLIRMITGIFYPDAGTILLNGKKFDPVKDVIDIGYMPEERGLYKKMKVGEQAMYLAQLKGLSKQEAFTKVKFWFERFEMGSWWNKKVEDLSKGMGQKLQFVTTVLHEPKLVILDEPFSGLDPVNSNLIKDEIYNLAQKGTTIIFSTHRMEQVEEICDHIVLVNKGNKILDGSVKEVKQQFKQHIFNAELNKLPAALQHPSFNIVKQNGNNLTLKINEGYQSNDILLHFINQQSIIVAYHEILPSLNEIFIRLVEGTPTSRQFQTVTA
ncbi:ATP-binding cassette domain-containing protein [Lacibacter luteus]|uniref:ATP-binding cassette domain-containing protein n=1 Tax=Lacibacter luteus TaxID=2508719 RepID=A0A4Q1CPB2_9BACT|nr:ABC transporter ATP-binding protein [Lacibacter luteus]RXK62571.1 ATP-binding cassette domain-containing protein [Lacibacter luteus]